MRVLAISDIEEPWLADRFDCDRVNGFDLIISCGDLPARYLERIVTLARAPLVYVPGNHDTGYADHAPEGCVPLDGELRDFCGLRLLGLGGSLAYAPHVYGCTEAEMRWNVARMSLLAQATGGADIVVTHAPAHGYGDLADMPHRGFEALNTLLDRVKPRYHLHGHVHMEYGRIARRLEHPSGATVLNVCGSYEFEIPDNEIVERTNYRILRVDSV